AGAGLERRQLDDLVLAAERALEARLELCGPHRREEADRAEVDADHRRPRAERALERTQHRAVPTEDDEEVGRPEVAVRRPVVLRGFVLRIDQLYAAPGSHAFEAL